jgi:hypothetical protein
MAYATDDKFIKQKILKEMQELNSSKRLDSEVI